MNDTRVSLDEYFMKIAEVVASRSTCLRHNMGAVTVFDKRILTTGYNGAPSGLKDCLELGCLRNAQNIPSGERTEICRAVHAEENALIQAGLHGISLEGATLYCTHSPCRRCAKMMINSKIKKLVFANGYADNTFEDLFTEAKIEWIHLEKKTTVSSTIYKIVPVVVACIVNPINGKILIQHRDPKNSPTNTYELPGGKVGCNESFENALIREVKEETDLDVHVNQLIHMQVNEYEGNDYLCLFYRCYPEINDSNLDKMSQFVHISREESNKWDLLPGSIEAIRRV